MSGRPEDEIPGEGGFASSEAKGDLISSASSFVSFRGNVVHSVDDKGRVSLPSEFRRVLQARFQRAVVLTNFISEGHRCIEGFALDAWEDFERRLREKSRFSSKLQRLENFYLSRASECPIDGSGRILLPTYLRTYAGLERDAVFTASIHGFRVWDKRVWDVIFAASEEALLKNPDLFADIDL
jgi:MraZ protein